MNVQIFVTLKKSVLDPQGEAIRKGLSSLGFDEVTQVRMGKYFEIAMEPGEDARERLDQMCQKLLANPVIEDYRIHIQEEKA